MRLNIEEVETLQARRHELNRLPLAKIEWYENDKPVLVDPSLIEEAESAGIQAIDFLECYLRGQDGP